MLNETIIEEAGGYSYLAAVIGFIGEKLFRISCCICLLPHSFRMNRFIEGQLPLGDFIVYLPIIDIFPFVCRSVRRLGLLNLAEPLADPIGHRLPPAWRYLLFAVLQLALFIRLQMAQVRHQLLLSLSVAITAARQINSN